MNLKKYSLSLFISAVIFLSSLNAAIPSASTAFWLAAEGRELLETFFAITNAWNILTRCKSSNIHAPQVEWTKTHKPSNLFTLYWNTPEIMQTALEVDADNKIVTSKVKLSEQVLKAKAGTQFTLYFIMLAFKAYVVKAYLYDNNFLENTTDHLYKKGIQYLGFSAKEDVLEWYENFTNQYPKISRMIKLLPGSVLLTLCEAALRHGLLSTLLELVTKHGAEYIQDKIK